MRISLIIAISAQIYFSPLKVVLVLEPLFVLILQHLNLW